MRQTKSSRAMATGPWLVRYLGFLETALFLVVSGCGNDATSPSPSMTPAVSCLSTASPTQLAPGAHIVVEPATTGGCLTIPQAGAAGAEYLVAALSTTGQVTDSGLSAPYELSAQTGNLTARIAAPLVAGRRIGAASPAARFHAMLRDRERELSRSARFQASIRGLPRPAFATAALGSQRSFQVCGDANCETFVTVTATVKHVGPHGLIYLDNAAPANGYSQGDLDRLGSLFDAFLYPIDTTAFGRETDLDGNGAAIILLSPAVNRLSGNCNQTHSVIEGFFFPDDLIPGSAGSNSGEIFYAIVPDPGSSICPITRSMALQDMGSTFLHEFQHMISFGRHAVLNNGASEDNWLDEGLSRFAEELGGREIPDSFCVPSSCLSQYPAGDIENAFEYLHKDTLDAVPLIEPANAADGTLSEDGANWLFVRWLADHFASDSILGTSLTRALDGADSPSGTGLTGSINVSSVVGVDFPGLIGEWQMANYLTAVPSFIEPTTRLRYKSWNFGSLFTANFGSYPLQPDSVTGSAAFAHSGVLHPGSGRHLLVVQNSSAPAVAVAFTSSDGMRLNAGLVPRFGVTRVH